MLLDNRKNGRVAEVLGKAIGSDARFSVLTNAFSIFAYTAMRQSLSKVSEFRLLLPDAPHREGLVGQSFVMDGLTGASADRSVRNKLDLARLARDCAQWLDRRAEVRAVISKIPQNLFHIANDDGNDPMQLT